MTRENIDRAIERIVYDFKLENVKNTIFMNLLAEAFPEMEVYAASMAQASALGAALAIHKNWNPKPIQNDLIDLKFYKH